MKMESILNFFATHTFQERIKWIIVSFLNIKAQDQCQKDNTYLHSRMKSDTKEAKIRPHLHKYT